MWPLQYSFLHTYYSLASQDPHDITQHQHDAAFICSGLERRWEPLSLSACLDRAMTSKTCLLPQLERMSRLRLEKVELCVAGLLCWRASILGEAPLHSWEMVCYWPPCFLVAASKEPCQALHPHNDSCKFFEHINEPLAVVKNFRSVAEKPIHAISIQLWGVEMFLSFLKDSRVNHATKFFKSTEMWIGHLQAAWLGKGEKDV